MEKVLTFTNEQKSLIWNRFVQPAKGTQEEANHFIEVCETFGLNPLLGDIVFQRYETKNGPEYIFHYYSRWVASCSYCPRRLCRTSKR